MSRKRRRRAAAQGSIYHYRAGQLTKLLGERQHPQLHLLLARRPDAPTSPHTGDDHLDRARSTPRPGLPVGEWAPFVKLDGTGRRRRLGRRCRGLPLERALGRLLRHPHRARRQRRPHDRACRCRRVTCPAFGGDDLRTLYITTAREGMTPEELEQRAASGSVFAHRGRRPRPARAAGQALGLRAPPRPVEVGDGGPHLEAARARVPAQPVDAARGEVVGIDDGRRVAGRWRIAAA